MNTNTAFNTLRAINSAKQNTGGYNVFAVTKSGMPSKTASRDYNGQTEFTRENADEVKTRLESLNPGRNWIVLPK